jgi:uncharacterized membrane protein
MKKIIAGFAIVAALSMTGCGSSSTPGSGKPPSDKTGEKTDTSFKFNSFTTAVSIKQGETKEEKITLSHGKDFSDKVNVKAEDDKKGLTLTLSKNAIDSSEKDVTLTIKADDKADLGDHMITVTGTPGKGGDDTTMKFTVKVSEKK